MSFTIFDIIIFTILVASTLHGAYRGIIKLILGLAGFLTSLLLTASIYPFINEILARHINNEAISTAASGILAYALSSILLSFIMSKLASTLSQLTSGIADKILGLIGGLVNGCAISIIIYLCLTAFYSGSYKKAENLEELIIMSYSDDRYPKWLLNSLTYEYLYEGADSIKNNMPKQYFKSIKLHQKRASIDDVENIYPEDLND